VGSPSTLRAGCARRCRSTRPRQAVFEDTTRARRPACQDRGQQLQGARLSDTGDGTRHILVRYVSPRRAAGSGSTASPGYARGVRDLLRGSVEGDAPGAASAPLGAPSTASGTAGARR
jgi:hypothetical protein